MLVDSHCHLDMVKDRTPEELVETAQNNGVSHFLCVSVDMHTFPTVQDIAQRFDNVSASVGVHPNSPVDDSEPTAEHLVTLTADDNIIAIGETGLDYYRSEGDLTWQHERFRTHIRAAKMASKPLIVHMRDAKEDTLTILCEENAAEVGGIMHCFVEDWETAVAAMEIGFYISFSGIVTFKSAKTLQDVARQMPLERMLIETDSPYLAPVPYRGKVNQPAYVRHVADFIAELRQDSFEHIAQKTTENFFTLFPDAVKQAA